MAAAASRPSAFWTKWWATWSTATSAPSAACTQRNFDGPIQTIIPWAGNLYTETLIAARAPSSASDFWGFWMLGGMSGGGMGFLFSPRRKPEAQERLQAIMSETKRAMEHSVPFAMEPVVYDFAINERGTQAALLPGDAALHARRLLHAGRAAACCAPSRATCSAGRRAELERFTAACQTAADFSGMVQNLFDHLLPRGARSAGGPRPQPGSIARSSRLRPRAARADPDRSARRPHRSGAESAAGDEPDRRCRAG